MSYLHIADVHGLRLTHVSLTRIVSNARKSFKVPAIARTAEGLPQTIDALRRELDLDVE